MCIINKNNVENDGYEDLRRQRAAYLLFHDKIEPEPNDLDHGLWNWNLSENSKPFQKFILHRQISVCSVWGSSGFALCCFYLAFKSALV